MNISSKITLVVAIAVTISGCDALADVSAGNTSGCRDGSAQARDDRAKSGYVQDVVYVAGANNAFLRVVYTGKNLQLVMMAIPPGQHIGAKTHADHDQFFRIDEGRGEVHINGVSTPISDRSGIIVPAGALHDVVNTGDRMMRLHSISAPPQLQMNTVRNSKADADAAAEHFDGCVSQ